MARPDSESVIFWNSSVSYGLDVSPTSLLRNAAANKVDDVVFIPDKGNGKKNIILVIVIS